MADYLLLLKISPRKIIDVLNTLRRLPNNPSDGVNLNYTMNIFGAWDVAVWFKAHNPDEAVDFVHRKIKDISGIKDVYTIPTFPHRGMASKTDDE